MLRWQPFFRSLEKGLDPLLAGSLIGIFETAVHRDSYVPCALAATRWRRVCFSTPQKHIRPEQVPAPASATKKISAAPALHGHTAPSHFGHLRAALRGEADPGTYVLVSFTGV